MDTKIEGITYDNSNYNIKEIFHNFNDSYKSQLLNISDRKIADLLSEDSLLIYTNPNKEKDDDKDYFLHYML